MNLAEFYATVSQEINRGSLYDTRIPDYVRRAALWIERNYSFKWTERFVRFTIDPEATYPRSISIPTELKSIEFLRLLPATLDLDNSGNIDQTEGGAPIYLRQCDPIEVTLIEKGTPGRYWLDSTEYLWFDKIPTEKFLGQMSYSQYTKWPTNLTETPVILSLAEDLLLAQTIIMMSPMMRNPVLRQMYEPMREEGLRTLIMADEELRNSNRDDHMEWSK